MANYWKERTEQICTRCNLLKPLSAYYKIGKDSHRYRTHCIECDKKANKKSKSNRIVTSEMRRQWYDNRRKNNQDIGRKDWYKSKYGITIEDYDRLLEQQNGLCAICGDFDRSNKKRLVVDHCHKTGNIRQLLCNNCNWAIGLFDDNPVFLENARNYLEMMAARFG